MRPPTLPANDSPSAEPYLFPSKHESFIGAFHQSSIQSLVHSVIGTILHWWFTSLHHSSNSALHHWLFHPLHESTIHANHHSCIAANHRFHRQFSSVSEKFANFVSATSSRGDQGLTKRNSKLCFCAYKLRSSTRKPPCPVLRTGESSHLATRYLYWNEPLV